MKSLKTLLLSAMLLVLPTSTIFAKGSSFSSGRSSGSSRSSSSSSFSRSTPSVPKTPSFSSGRTTTPSAPPSKPSGFSSSSSKPSTTVPSTTSKPKTSFDHAQQRVALPPPMKPKETYVNDFKAANAAKYPTTFATPPAQRPSYIPPTTVHNNVNYPIQYNPATQSYGFFDGLGKFMVYDAITNMAMKSFESDSRAHNQAVAAANAANSQAASYNSNEDEGSGWGTFFFWLFVIVIILIIIAALGGNVSSSDVD